MSRFAGPLVQASCCVPLGCCETPSCPGPVVWAGYQCLRQDHGHPLQHCFLGCSREEAQQSPGEAGAGHCCALAALEGLGSHRALCCCLFPALLWHILSLNHFLPPIPFFQRCFCCCLLPSSCFVAPAILTTQLTIYPDGAALVSCAWHVFSIYKFCVRAEATNPNYLCEVSGACLLWPHLASPDPSPSPAPFRPHLGVLSSLSLLFPSRRSHHQTSPWPSCSKELPLFS